MPMNWYLIVVVGGVALFYFIWALLKNGPEYSKFIENEVRDHTEFEEEKSILDTHNFSTKQELKRKIFHFFSILYNATWVVQPLIFFGVTFVYSIIANTTTAEDYFNTFLLFEDAQTNQILINGLIAQFFIILCTFFFNANAEIMRLRFEGYGYPLKKTIRTTRRFTETLDISASILLLLGLEVSTLILTYGSQYRIAGIYAQMAVVSISVLSDMAAALVGRRWGKHKWPFVKGKSFEGSAAGFVVGFFSALVFVGPILALIGALVFVFTDVFLAKLNISDNASNPIILALVFKLLIFLVSPMILIIPFIRIW
jgi:dolichol kinase